MDSDKEYFAFISYKSEDAEWAIWLQHELEHYHLPASFNGREDVRQELRPVFRDIDELAAGNLPGQIQRALANSQNLIVVCSPQSAASEWVNQEVETFITLGKTDCIFPFIVEGNSPNEYFPPALLALPRKEERLGGDATKQGRDMAFVKVVAGMLEVGFDSLWDRYEKEKAVEERKQREQRDNLQRLQSRLVAEKVKGHLEEDTYFARRVLLDILPMDLAYPDRAFSPESEEVFRQACSRDRFMIQSKKEISYCPVISGDGRYVLMVDDSVYSIWEVATGRLLTETTVYQGTFAEFGPDGRFFVVCTISDCIILKDTLSGTEVASLNESGDVFCVAFSYDGNLVAFSSTDGNYFRVWDWRNNTCGPKLFGHTEWVRGLAFSHDGKYIASTADDGTIRVWELTTGRCVKTLDFQEVSAYMVVWTADDSRLVFGLRDNTIRVWDIALEQYAATLSRHSALVTKLILSQDGNLLMSVSNDRMMCLWNTATWECLFEDTMGEDGDRLDVSPDYRFYTLTSEKSVRLEALNDNRQMLEIETNDIFCKGNMCFNPGGSRILSSHTKGLKGYVQVYDVLSGNLVFTTESASAITESYAVFSNDGKKIIELSQSEISIYDAEAGRCMEKVKLESPLSGIWHYAFSPCCTLVAASSAREMKVWDIKTGLVKLSIKEKEHSFVFEDLSISSDGTYIAACNTSIDGGKTVYIWEIDTMQCIQHRFEKGCGGIQSMAFSPEGNRIAISFRNDSIYIWDVVSDDVILFKPAAIHVMEGGNICYSPDGKYILSVYGNEIALFDIETSIPIYRLQTDEQCCKCVLSPDGRKIAAMLKGGVLCVWDFPPLQELIDETRERFKDNPLSPEERKQYYLE